MNIYATEIRNKKNNFLLHFFTRTPDVMYHIRSPGKKVSNRNYFSYISTKTYVVGTQKNRLDEMVLLRAANIGLN